MKTCCDCGDECSELRSWKYEPEVKLCENCHERKTNEECEE